MVIVVVLARRLGPGTFGIFVFSQWLIEITALVCSAGLPGAATRFFPQTAAGSTTMPGLGRWFLRRGAIVVGLTSLVATGNVILFSDLVETVPVAAIVALWAASSAAWALLGARVLGMFQFKRFAASSALFVTVAVVGLMLPLDGDIVPAIAILGLANFVAASYCAVDLFSAGRMNNGEPLGEADGRLIASYAKNTWLTSVAASFVWARGEISIVKGHLGESAVGLYSVGLTLSGLVNQGIGLLTGGLWPQIASGWDHGDRDGVLRLSASVTNVLIQAAALSAGFVICFAPYLVVVLFGEPFHQSSGLVSILAFGTLSLGSGCAHLVLQAATNGRFARNATVAGGCALFTVAFILVPQYGIAGAAIARSATQIALAIATFVWLGRVVGHNVGTRQNLRSFVLHTALALTLVLLLAWRPDLSGTGRLTLFLLYFGLACFFCAPMRNAGALRDLRSLVGGGH